MNSQIRPIDTKSVHQICSGQVVLTLAVAVKELVENSLDAGATQIDIRLKQFGAEMIEVIDNGSGVEEENFQALTLKHHTSKIRLFDDVIGVDTYGFRGEALSSLCALSNLKVITCHKSAKVGTKLEYDRDGVILVRSNCPRQVGTTVQISKIFQTLPVRHRELQHNLKREFAKMCHCLHGYCLVVPHVRFLVVTEDGQGRRSTIISTPGNSTVINNITSIFGVSQASTLIPFLQTLPSEAILQDFNLKGEVDMKGYKIVGYLSSCHHGKGRATTDRQFISLNKRPCDLIKVTKLINAVYHQYNRQQFPFVALDITLNKKHLDVNITPDKRSVMIINELCLMALIKASLLSMFDDSASCVPNNSNNVLANETITKQPLLSMFSRGPKRAVDNEVEASSARNTGKQPKLDSFVKIWKTCDIVQNVTEANDQGTSFEPSGDGGPLLQSSCKQSTVLESPAKETWCSVNKIDLSLNSTTDFSDNDLAHIEPSKTSEANFETDSASNYVACDNENDSEMSDSIVEDPCTAGGVSNSHSSDSCAIKIEEVFLRTSPRPNVCIEFNMDDLKARLNRRDETGRSNRLLTRRFHAKINPQENGVAENELKKELKKELFSEMEVIGQFNLGFVIAKLNTDLFIVDQHASDEKYNFESLIANTTLENQRLIIPQALPFTAIEENIIIDHIDVFRRNGFEFKIDQSAESNHKIQLISIPQSRNYSFGKEDIDELIFMLQDSPEVTKHFRPSRVLAMFASRACRKSVMVGTPLNVSNMKKILKNMSTLHQPWNCPHGRPTIRHLIDLNLLVDMPVHK